MKTNPTKNYRTIHFTDQELEKITIDLGGTNREIIVLTKEFREKFWNRE
ncbi:MAG: hypothetical protein LBL13_12870 [Bacteroidales bacterium]|jgi:hypothetical protein|nr:hypothetical protein [Bacteroidales bacterium]